MSDKQKHVELWEFLDRHGGNLEDALCLLLVVVDGRIERIFPQDDITGGDLTILTSPPSVGESLEEDVWVRSKRLQEERKDVPCPFGEHDEMDRGNCWGGPKLRQIDYDTLIHSVLLDALELESDEDAVYLFQRIRQYKPADAPKD